MRLFIASNLPDDEKARLYAATATLRTAGLPVRWVAQPSLHLTLRFLGEVKEPAMNAVAHALAEMAPHHPRFALSMGGLGAFPGLRRPRVIWLGLKAAPELLGLQSAVESAMTDLGYPREDRAWSPHLTLGRAEERARAADFAGLETMAHDITYRATVDIISVDLMRSHLERGGARYERIAAFPLRATNPVEPAK